MLMACVVAGMGSHEVSVPLSQNCLDKMYLELLVLIDFLWPQFILNGCLFM